MQHQYLAKDNLGNIQSDQHDKVYHTCQLSSNKAELNPNWVGNGENNPLARTIFDILPNEMLD